jgi:phosphotransferase system IIB component
MGHRNIAELTHAFSKIRAEVNDLKNIKAEVDYKDLGVDDGTTARYAYS